MQKTPPTCFSVSEIEFTNGFPNLGGVGLMQICAENALPSSFGKNQNNQNDQTLSKFKSQKLVQA